MCSGGSKCTIHVPFVGRHYAVNHRVVERPQQVQTVHSHDAHSRHPPLQVGWKLSKITRVLERIPMEHIDSICSSKSDLFFVSLCSIRIPYRNRDNVDNFQPTYTATNTPIPSASSNPNNWQDIIEEEDLDWTIIKQLYSIFSHFSTKFRAGKISDQIKSFLGAIPNPLTPIKWVQTALFGTRKRLLEDRATGAHDQEHEEQEPPKKKRYLSTSR